MKIEVIDSQDKGKPATEKFMADLQFFVSREISIDRLDVDSIFETLESFIAVQGVYKIKDSAKFKTPTEVKPKV
jgi:hypothetical protein